MKKYLCIIILCTWTAMLNAQVTIRGRVLIDGTNSALEGATILNTVTGVRAVSDSAGYFVISAGANRVRLTVTYIGFEPVSAVVNTPLKQPLIIKLGHIVRTLDEVVVSTGYQDVPQDRATGSFSQVSNSLFNRRVSSDVLSRLEGVVPGLLFNRNTNAAANGAADISVRGTSTLFASTQPLYVVDGFPYDGDITDLDPNTVESISVLKDAAAASIWGVKSGNGVIVITTRHGSRGKKLTIDFNASLTVGARPDVYYSPDFLSSNDFIGVEQTLFNKGYYDPDLAMPYSLETPVVDILAKVRSGTLSKSAGEAQIAALRNVDVRNDISKYFYRRSAEQQYSLDINGGGTNSDYFIAGSFDDNQASAVGNGNKRTTLSTLYNVYPTSHLMISAGLNFSQTIGTVNSPVSGINGGGAYSIYPYAQLVGKNGAALPIARDYDLGYTDTAGNGKFYNWQYRPYDELHNADNSFSNLDDRINLSAKYTFLNGFTAEARYEYENQQSKTANNYNDQTYYARDLVNRYAEMNPDGSVNYIIPQGGVLKSTDGGLIAQRGRVQLDYNKTWHSKNELTEIAGAEVNQTITDQQAGTLYGYDKSTLTNQLVDFADYYPVNPDGSYYEIPTSQSLSRFTDRYISYYSNAGYTYDSRYSVSLSGRIDKSNLFGVNTNQKSVPLYSAGLAWDISKESFYRLAFLPHAKLRVTYGYNGNIDKNVAALTTFQQFNNAPYTGLPFSIIGSPGNPDLRWERVKIINLGFDFRTRNDLLSGTIEYYLKRGLDIFGDTPLAPSTGFQLYRGNTADIKGNGLDVNLTANIIRAGKFQWQSNFMLSYVMDKVTKYDASISPSNYISLGAGNAGVVYPLTGKPLFAIYSYQWGGLTHDNGNPQGYLDGQKSTDYTAIIAGATTATLQYNGPSRPTTFGSFRNTFSYQRLSLSMNIIYKLNYYFRRSSISYTELYTAWTGNKDFDRRWQQPGDELRTNVPSIAYPPLIPTGMLFISIQVY